ncbi:MAG: VOC family protein [Chloroflexi bacterium]|nr:VOC family protein [Chloroflexota bacterium]
MAEDWVRPVVHWEIRAKDAEAMRSFYAQMFNWPISDGPIMNIPAGVGAPDDGPAGHITQDQNHTGVALYIQVRDLDASLAQTKTLGGTQISQPLNIPGGATFARIADPEGNSIVLVQQ